MSTSRLWVRDEEDSSPLLPGRGQPTENKSETRRRYVWGAVGLSSAVVAVVVIGTLMLSSSDSTPVKSAAVTTKTSSPQTSKSTSVKKGAEATSFSTLTDGEKQSMFDSFKSTFGKKYDSDDEEATKYSNFKDFLVLIDERNAAEVAKGGFARHGVTKFSDLSHAEFRKGYLNYKKSTRTDADVMKKTVQLTKRSTATTSVDWSGIYTTDVKDQGYCGSCWAFSATEQLESDAIRTGVWSTSDALSPQQIVSCDQIDLGCDGGDPTYAYYYAYSAGGLTTDALYPYISYWGTTYSCTIGSDELYIKPTAYSELADEDSMITYVLETGPVSVCVDADSWSSYVSGIVSDCGMSVDHCVQAVGVDTVNKYWKVRNSWGTTWGAQGYIYLALGENMCNIASETTFTYVENVSTSSSTKKSAKKSAGPVKPADSSKKSSTGPVKPESSASKKTDGPVKPVVTDASKKSDGPVKPVADDSKKAKSA